jgi:hypothetical protein
MKFSLGPLNREGINQFHKNIVISPNSNIKSMAAATHLAINFAFVFFMAIIFLILLSE